jgi:CRISPR-associated protein Cmr4
MNALTFFRTLTPTRVGVGQAAGIIDQPVMREAATRWPIIPGSSLKGVLRDRAASDLVRTYADDPDQSPAEHFSRAERELRPIFGSSDSDDPRGGSLVLSDLQCLFFPVRSFAGVYALATCPLALDELRTKTELAGLSLPVPSFTLKAPADGSFMGMVAADCVLKSATESQVFIDEFRVEVSEQSSLGDFGTALEAHLGMSGRIANRLLVLEDTLFTYLCESSTEVRTRTALDYGIKKVKAGSLRTEEYVPSQAVFVGFAMGVAVASNFDLAQIGDLQVGANASVGAGYGKFKVVLPK